MNAHATCLPSAPIARIAAARWTPRAGALADAMALLQTRQRALICARDARAATLGAIITRMDAAERVIASAPADERSVWAERIMLEHARRFLRTLESWDRGDRWLVPAPWRALFAAARQGALSPGATERLAARLHLVYDLPLAIAAVGPGGLSRSVRASILRTLASSSGDRSWPWRPSPWMLAWRASLELRTAVNADERRRVFERIEWAALRDIADTVRRS